MMRSAATIPVEISIVWPRSRAIFTGFNVTLPAPSSTATRRPFWPKISALDGIDSVCIACGSSTRALAKAPGMSSPEVFSITTCMCVVPEPASTEREEASTRPL